MSSYYRSFGVEIETFKRGTDGAAARALVAQGLTQIGVRTMDQHHHNGTEYGLWQAKPDGTIRQSDNAARVGWSVDGVEVVSRVLPGTEESIEEVTKVTSWLRANGFDVNKTCGLHIHIDVSDLTRAEAAAVALRYHHRIEDFHSILPASRRANVFCSPWVGSDLRKLEDAVRGESVGWSHGERYHPVNMEHVRDRGSRLEFRHHGGTLQAPKIIGWYKLVCAFIAETVKIMRSANIVVDPPLRHETSTAVAASYVMTPSTYMPRVRTQRRVRRDAVTRSTIQDTTTPRVPYIRPGSDYEVFLQTLHREGYVARSNTPEEWPASRVRVTAHWLRRQGAAIVTNQGIGETTYTSSEFGQPALYSEFLAHLFRNPAEVRVRRTVAPATIPAPAPAPAPVRAAFGSVFDVIKDAPIEQGLPEEVLSWFKTRQEDLAQ